MKKYISFTDDRQERLDNVNNTQNIILPLLCPCKLYTYKGFFFGFTLTSTDVPRSKINCKHICLLTEKKCKHLITKVILVVYSLFTQANATEIVNTHKAGVQD